MTTHGHQDGALITEYITTEGFDSEGNPIEVSYYFIEEIQRPLTPTVPLPLSSFEWTAGDGVWTTQNFIDRAVGPLDVTADNMVNLTG